MTNERRLHSRIAFHSPATLVIAENRIEGLVLDISLRGALVRLPAGATLEPGTLCMLHVQLNENGVNDQISMEARVAHVQGRYIGLLCLSIDIDSITHLRRLVELNLSDPDLLEREISALISE